MKLPLSAKAVATKVAIASSIAALGSTMFITTAANALTITPPNDVNASVNANANVSTSTNSTTNSSSTNVNANEQTRLQNIISKGDQEITRRLSSLTTLSAKINAATRLTASDKTTLTNEVNDTITGLTALKTKLDSETTITAARADAQDIYTEYRVYALVAPKINLIKVADDQQVVEQKLQTLIQKFQTRINAAKAKGKEVSAIQDTLSDMNANATASASVSSSIEAKVIGLQPTDWNSDHQILSGDSAQLKTAHIHNVAAYNDAKQIVAGLKALE